MSASNIRRQGSVTRKAPGRHFTRCIITDGPEKVNFFAVWPRFPDPSPRGEAAAGFPFLILTNFSRFFGGGFEGFKHFGYFRSLLSCLSAEKRVK